MGEVTKEEQEYAQNEIKEAINVIEKTNKSNVYNKNTYASYSITAQLFNKDLLNLVLISVRHWHEDRKSDTNKVQYKKYEIVVFDTLATENVPYRFLSNHNLRCIHTYVMPVDRITTNVQIICDAVNNAGGLSDINWDTLKIK